MSSRPASVQIQPWTLHKCITDTSVLLRWETSELVPEPSIHSQGPRSVTISHDSHPNLLGPAFRQKADLIYILILLPL